MDKYLYRSNGDVLLMSFQDYCWADSDIENITIEYDHASLIIWNDTLQKNLSIECFGFAGITNLCIWDDTIITTASIHTVCDTENEFLTNLYAAYCKNRDYGGRSLCNGLLELRIELSNYIPFSIYCQRIEVIEGQGDRGHA